MLSIMLLELYRQEHDSAHTATRQETQPAQCYCSSLCL